MSRYPDGSTCWRKFAGIIGDGIDHEEGERLVCLHHGIGRLYHELDVLHLESQLTLVHNVKQWLQRETLYTQVQGSLTHLYPLGEHLVVLIDLIGEL